MDRKGNLLQAELSKLIAEEEFVLTGYSVRQAESSSELSSAQIAELDQRYANAAAHPEKLLPPEEAVRLLKR